MFNPLVVNFSLETFLSVLELWITNPEIVVPPVKSATILSDTRSDEDDCHVDHDSHHDEVQDDGEYLQREIIRQLNPKRTDKDRPFQQRIQFFRSKQGIRVRFEGMAATFAEYPYYYPKIKSYDFCYFEDQQEQDPEAEAEERKAKLIFEFQPHPEHPDLSAKEVEVFSNLFKRLAKWGKNREVGYVKKTKYHSLFTKEKYEEIYARLKGKYAHWVKIWEESTDPSKFVFEDIGIASYLICLWESEGAEDLSSSPYSAATASKGTKKFVDLGCGNGFLVYILTKEGYSGVGFDMAERKIWQKFRNDGADLRKETIIPNETVYEEEEYEWLIGNHSDELSPWIPVITYLSGPKTKYFLLPCCPFDFGGRYTKNNGEGRYKTYLKYLEHVAQQCGFQLETENIRIPSTKNVVQIGRFRNPEMTNEQIDDNIEELFKNARFHCFIPRLTDKQKTELYFQKLKAKIN